MGEIEVTYLECGRCNHKWIPRKPETPKTCPKCNSPYWDKPYTRSDKVKSIEEDK